MEPSYNALASNAEQSPSLPAVAPEFSPSAPIEQTPDRQMPRFEQETGVAQPAPVPVPVDTAAVPTIPAPQSAATPVVAPQADDMPILAADEDLIEKEWVDKAKKIIAETADNPRQREEAVSQLQREYLRKRYGKELGSA